MKANAWRNVTEQALRKKKVGSRALQFIYLFHDTVNMSKCTKSNDGTITEQWIGKGTEENGLGLI
jgi:hypothetical protein